jgi:hypothetical protein
MQYSAVLFRRKVQKEDSVAVVYKKLAVTNRYRVGFDASLNLPEVAIRYGGWYLDL